MKKSVHKQTHDERQLEAVELLQQALNRIKYPSCNANGGNVQAGGAYWRLAKVLKSYLEPMLIQQEGQKHAEHLIRTHGRITP